MIAPIDDDLQIPAFLQATTRGNATRPRRRKLKAKRPEGEKWAKAARWEVTIGPDLSFTKASGRAGLAAGTRYVWVIEGTKWVQLRDSEDFVKISRAAWLLLAKAGRQVKA